MGNEKAEELIKKYLAGTATQEEEALLESWYILTAHDQQERRIASAIRLWPRIAAAAAVLVILSVGSLFIVSKRTTQRIAEPQPLAANILPAGTRATVTLLDGQTISVDSIGSRALARQGNAHIRTLNGQLIYSRDLSGPSAGHAGTMAYNTLTTKPGEHYTLRLPDGTRVWLNAASSITYPVIFNGKERRVSITGELYFEIAHNARQPFRVAVKDQLVEDLGTHLNINAYDDEPAIHTTLLEGSIKVMRGGASVILTPGQQAAMRPGDTSFQIRQVGAEEAVAWKNGYFYFDRADMRAVMRELARWYNIQVIYKGGISKRKFKGKLYRNINAAAALGILSYFGAHFHIEGKTITVSA